MDSAKPKIALAITLSEPGGATSFVLGFAKWLRDRGYDLDILGGDGSWLEDRCREEHIRFHRIKSLYRDIDLTRDVFAYRELKHKLKELKPDAIHLNSSKMGVLGGMAARHLRIPHIVYRIGGWAFLEPMTFPFPTVYRLAEKWTAKNKDLIICLHEGDLHAAQRAGIRPRREIRVIPNGIDLPHFDRALLTREQARRALNIDTPEFIFGTIAHFYPAKDLPRYMEACKIVHETRPDARFLLIGNGKELYRIRKKRADLNLEDCVLMLGDHENASTLLNGFDAFVLPSVKEGMSRALLEAMAASRPCLATNVGANNELLRDECGWIVPPQTPHALAEAMLFVMDHPEEAQRRGQRARQLIEKDYPLERTYRENERALVE